MVSRESIYEALYQKLIKITIPTPFRTTSRRLRHWADVPQADQPALFLAQGAQTATVEQRLPTRWTLGATLYLYANTGGDLKQNPMTLLNPILDQIVDNLLPEDAFSGEQTLGGLVERCRIDGEIETDEGTLGDQAVVIVPIKMFLPQ